MSASGRWFSPCTPVSSTNKTNRHDITEILLKVKVALNTTNESNQPRVWDLGGGWHILCMPFDIIIGRNIYHHLGGIENLINHQIVIHWVIWFPSSSQKQWICNTAADNVHTKKKTKTKNKKQAQYNNRTNNNIAYY